MIPPPPKNKCFTVHSVTPAVYEYCIGLEIFPYTISERATVTTTERGTRGESCCLSLMENLSAGDHSSLRYGGEGGIEGRRKKQIEGGDRKTEGEREG